MAVFTIGGKVLISGDAVAVAEDCCCTCDKFHAAHLVLNLGKVGAQPWFVDECGCVNSQLDAGDYSAWPAFDLSPLTTVAHVLGSDPIYGWSAELQDNSKLFLQTYGPEVDEGPCGTDNINVDYFPTMHIDVFCIAMDEDGITPVLSIEAYLTGDMPGGDITVFYGEGVLGSEIVNTITCDFPAFPPKTISGDGTAVLTLP